MTRDLSWADFVSQAEQLAEDALEPGFDEDGHARALAALSARLDLTDLALVTRLDELTDPQATDYTTDMVIHTPTCRVMLVSLRAGAHIALHDHPNTGGFICCESGEIQVEAFDIISEDPLRLRRVIHDTLTPGDTAALTSTHANLHRLYCPTAARMIDVFTPIVDGERPSMRWFALEQETSPEVFAARLTPAPP